MKPILLIFPILFETLSEGLELRGVKFWGKQVEILELIGWFLVLMVFGWDVYVRAVAKLLYSWKGFLKLWGSYVLVYFLLRVIFFNYAHNLAAYPAIQHKLETLGLSSQWYDVLYYLGNVSFIDRIIALINGAWWMIVLVQVICAVVVWGIVKRKS